MEKADNFKKIAFFDFDGTITRRDSFLDFLKSVVGPLKLILGGIVLFPILVLYGLKIIDNEKAKGIFMNFFFKNRAVDKIKAKTRLFAENKLPEIVKQSALDRINWHKSQGHPVYLVSASFTLWLSYWCEAQGIGMICTELEEKDGRFTGKLATRNCYGQEKVNRIKEAVDLAEYQYIYAYGDTRGDKEMLEMADEKYYRHFE